jgi:acetoin utilization deacetylase AcuC-like enzyme
VIVFDDPRMEAHDPGPDHPERPARLAAVRRGLRAVPGLEWRAPRMATADELATVHDRAYVDAILATRGQATFLDADTRTSAGSVDAALLAAGAVLDAVDAVIAGPDRRAFAAVRPPGHHAERGAAMGFCLFSNVALAAVRALSAGVERVLVADWDVHHGNGTQHLLASREDALFFSTHQGFGFYPGTGQRSQGNALNAPLRPGDGHEALLAAFRDALLPAAEAFRPGLVLVSAGFDAHRDDPLGGLLATEETFRALTALLRDLADRHAGGRIVLALEGGYDLGALERSARACAEALA